MENLQSAEKAYQQLAEMKEEMSKISKVNEALNNKVKEMESGSELEKYKTMNDELTKMVQEQKEQLLSQQALVNKLIIAQGMPVDEKTGTSQQEEAEKKEVDAILAEISRQNSLDGK